MGKRIGIGLAILVVLGLFLVGTGATFITDWLWFSALGYGQLFLLPLTWHGGLFVTVLVLSFGFVFINLNITRSHFGQLLWQHQQISDAIRPGHISWVFAAISAGLALLLAVAAGNQSWTVIQFVHRVSFDAVDPLFGLDISFFLFSLPFFRMVLALVSALLLLTTILVAISYGVSRALTWEGILRGQGGRPGLHLSLLAAMYILTYAVSYQLRIWELVYAADGAVFGAGYTDVTVRMPTLQVLSVLAVLVAVALVAFHRKQAKLVAGLLALWVVISVLFGGIVPALVQQWVVEPNEFNRERPYLENHVAMTRMGYNLDHFIQRPFPANVQLTADTLETYQAAINNARLWDPRPMLDTIRQLQEMRPYYRFIDADIGRYWVNGEYRQVLLSAREMVVELLQNRTWINEHLQYTHGYGVVMSPVNEVTGQQMPQFWISDIPPRSTIDIEVTEPRIYYGEHTNQYVLVNTRTEEFDYPMGNENAYTNYVGVGGVQLSSFLHRLVFAVRTGDYRILVSSELTNESRILFDRNILQRVRKIAPFLRYDNDPYLVISEEGRLFWIIDAYTTSNRFPYSAPTRNWGNYVRNSIKVVVDAYHGTVNFYQVEPDPVAEVYAAMFPGWLQPGTDMPNDIRAHIRYPEDYLTLQGRMFGTYHMTDMRVFYNREDVWVFAREQYAGREQEVEPYYVITQLPGETEPEMVLMLPFTPIRRNNMIAWLGARNDGAAYGQVVVYSFPKDELTMGPAQIEARIDQDSEISQQLTLWGQRGSRVIRGNLLVLPVGDGIIYVEPLYLQSDQSGIPQLQRVIVVHGDDLVMAPTLEQALQTIFSSDEEQTPTVIEPSVVLNDEGWYASGTAAYEAYQRAARALQDARFDDFGRAWSELEEILRELVDE